MNAHATGRIVARYAAKTTLSTRRVLWKFPTCVKEIARFIGCRTRLTRLSPRSMQPTTHWACSTPCSGRPFYLYSAHYEDRLKRAPWQLIAQRDGGICIATIDGAVWTTHLARDQVNPEATGRITGPGESRNLEIRSFPNIKLPATLALGRRAANLPWSPLPINHTADYRTFQEIRYVEERLFFDFYNGTMSTDQCYRLRDAFLFARAHA